MPGRQEHSWDPTDAPRVSVLVTTYNYARYVPEALDSIGRQTYRDYEVVVADDCSTDDSLEIINALDLPNVRVVTGENVGLPRNLVRGLAECRGELISFLSADDRWLPHHLENGVRALDAYPEAALAYGHLSTIDENGQEVSGQTRVIEGAAQCRRIRPEELLPQQFMPTQAMIMRRDALEAVGGIDPSATLMSELDLLLRIVARYPVVDTARITTEKRVHRASLSRDVTGMLEARLELYDKHLGQQTTRLKRRMVADAYWRTAYRELIYDPTPDSFRQAKVHMRKGLATYPPSVLRRHRLVMLIGRPIVRIVTERGYVDRIRQSGHKSRLKRLLGVRK